LKCPRRFNRMTGSIDPVLQKKYRQTVDAIFGINNKTQAYFISPSYLCGRHRNGFPPQRFSGPPHRQPWRRAFFLLGMFVLSTPFPLYPVILSIPFPVMLFTFSHPSPLFLLVSSTRFRGSQGAFLWVSSFCPQPVRVILFSFLLALLSIRVCSLSLTYQRTR
jgi:hypothetical protein